MRRRAQTGGAGVGVWHPIGDDRDLLGDDWWPYVIAANRAAIDAVLRYHHEQGLTKRRFSIEDVFVPDLLDT